MDKSNHTMLKATAIPATVATNTNSSGSTNSNNSSRNHHRGYDPPNTIKGTILGCAPTGNAKLQGFSSDRRFIGGSTTSTEGNSHKSILSTLTAISSI